MSYNPIKPYNDLPELPPKIDLENVRVLKKTISASRALSELKAAMSPTLNRTISS